MKDSKYGTINIDKKLIPLIRIYCGKRGLKIFMWLSNLIEKELNKQEKE